MVEFTFEIRSLLGGNNGISRKNGFWQKMQSRRAEIRHQRFVYSKKHETRFVPGRAVCPPPHKIRSHHGGVSCTRRRMAKRERCTFLLHFFSNEAVNSFPSKRGTTLPPDFKVGRPSRRPQDTGKNVIVTLKISAVERKNSKHILTNI